MYRTNDKRLLTTLLVPFLLLVAPACVAERADRNATMNLEADQVTMDDAQHISTFTGNVRLSQGTLLIQGDKIVVTQDPEGFKHATAYGNTAQFRQKREGLDEYVEGYGNRIEYDMRTETLNFYEKARLKRNLDEVNGDHITYSAKTEIFQANGNAANSSNGSRQRVRAVLQPKSQKNPSTSSAPGALPIAPHPSPTPAQ
ncbi:MAG: lipopolysaccharide transport periplasmic protein LptA [Gallionella sp.]